MKFNLITAKELHGKPLKEFPLGFWVFLLRCRTHRTFSVVSAPLGIFFFLPSKSDPLMMWAFPSPKAVEISLSPSDASAVRPAQQKHFPCETTQAEKEKKQRKPDGHQAYFLWGKTNKALSWKLNVSTDLPQSFRCNHTEKSTTEEATPALKRAKRRQKKSGLRSPLFHFCSLRSLPF